MALVLNGKDVRAITLMGGEVGIARLELQAETLTAGLAIIVLELDLAVDALVGVRTRHAWRVHVSRRRTGADRQGRRGGRMPPGHERAR
jgi:hypothetical protein